MADADYAFALSLQDEFSSLDNDVSTVSGTKRKLPASVVDDCWETIDPTPDIRELFLQFNDIYFYGKLSCCEVKWAPRMTLCAGVCCYEGRGGLCSIKLGMPLLKLRPRKDLVQTLLHEMIHAYLFVTHNNKDHDAHGIEFHKHMHRINKASGANITVYHNFHDEVDLYRQHWWRCDGPCQKRPPYYGLVKRAMNRPPSAQDPWWPDHRRSCGGTYHKVREPEDYGKKKRKKDDNTNSGNTSSGKDSKTNGMPKIYDLWKKEVDGNSKRTNAVDLSKNTKPEINDLWRKELDGKSSRTSSSSDDISKNIKPEINDLPWRVENDNNSTSGSEKENHSQKLNSKFTPFAGRGHVLGSVKLESSTNSVSKHAVGVLKSRGFRRGSSVEANGKGPTVQSRISKIGSTTTSNRNNKNSSVQTNTSRPSFNFLSKEKKIGEFSEGLDLHSQGTESSDQNNGKNSTSRSGRLSGNTLTRSKTSTVDIDDIEQSILDNIDIGEHLKSVVDLVETNSNRGSLKAKKSNILNINEGSSKDSGQKDHLGIQLTIVDAFKKAGDKKSPFIVIDDTPSRSESTSAVARLLSCPVCLTEVDENKINAHLDACLS